jgi:hypothetical protein
MLSEEGERWIRHLSVIRMAIQTRFKIMEQRHGHSWSFHFISSQLSQTKLQFPFSFNENSWLWYFLRYRPVCQYNRFQNSGTVYVHTYRQTAGTPFPGKNDWTFYKLLPLVSARNSFCKDCSYTLIFHRKGQISYPCWGAGLDDEGSIPGRNTIFFSIPQGPDWLWSQPSLIFNGYQRLFPRW